MIVASILFLLYAKFALIALVVGSGPNRNRVIDRPSADRQSGIGIIVRKTLIVTGK